VTAVADLARGVLVPWRRLSRSPAAAGVPALDLRDAMATTGGLALGASTRLAMRMALHAGSVHQTVDPLAGLQRCVGAHVSRAARLEPRVPAGLVHASESFDALAGIDAVTKFRCDCVQQPGWAKRYGTFPARACIVLHGGQRPPVTGPRYRSNQSVTSRPTWLLGNSK
jgi:hypothetical protein